MVHLHTPSEGMVSATRRKQGAAILCAGSLLACAIFLAEVHSELGEHGVSISVSSVDHQAALTPTPLLSTREGPPISTLRWEEFSARHSCRSPSS